MAFVSYRLAAACLLSLLLAACGFHPRGSIDTLTDPGSIFVDAGREIAIAAELREALADQSFRIARTRDEADVLLRLTGERESRRIVSVQSTGRVSEFELSHVVNMQIAQAVGTEPARYDPDQTPNRVEVIREYTYDERGVLGKEEEARILRSEMREELIRQIVLRTVAGLASQKGALDASVKPVGDSTQ